MANNYSCFSEEILDLTEEEKAWAEHVLRPDWEFAQDLEELKKEFDLTGEHVFDGYPHFEWQVFEDNALWLFSVEDCNEEHLAW